MKTNAMQQSELLKQILETSQANQRKELENKHDRGKKELKAKQAKASMDSVKSVSVDKTIKNKAERDRYVCVCVYTVYW